MLQLNDTLYHNTAAAIRHCLCLFPLLTLNVIVVRVYFDVKQKCLGLCLFVCVRVFLCFVSSVLLSGKHTRTFSYSRPV